MDSATNDSYSDTYVPLSTGIVSHIQIEYSMRIRSGANMSGANAFGQVLDFSGSNTSEFELMWGNDLQWWTRNNQGTVNATGFNFNLNQYYDVVWYVDLLTDQITLEIDGNNILTNHALASSENSLNYFNLYSNDDSTGTVDIKELSIHANHEIPEPGSAMVLVAASAFGLVLRRRRS